MQLALAPMEGLVDDILRDVLTGVGGIDWCVTEFVRVNDKLLPAHVFHRLAPELRNGSRTRAGTPMRVQLLGSDPACIADNAAFACTLGAPVIDLNFGCPAKTVNRSRGGAVLLKEPELLHAIVREVRRALASGGASQIVVHARTKADGYRPPAHWEWIARVQDTVDIPVYANGEIWSVEDWQRCRAASGATHMMLGRGLVARPDLALAIRAAHDGREHAGMDWTALSALLRDFWAQQRRKLEPGYAPGRLKQWLIWLGRSSCEAAALFTRVRRETDCAALDAIVEAA